MIDGSEIVGLAAKVLAKAMLYKDGFDFDVPAVYSERFAMDAKGAGLVVTQINTESYNGLITYGVYRDHHSMIKGEKRR